MARLTKRQAANLLAAYTNEQTAATNAAIDAYNRQVDTATAATERELQAEREAASAEAAASIDRAAVAALIRRRAIAETLANRGLTRSGTADNAKESVAAAARIAVGTARADERAALGALSQKLVTAQEAAAAKKAQNTANAQKTLAAKIAEKKLTLNKQTL